MSQRRPWTYVAGTNNDVGLVGLVIGFGCLSGTVSEEKNDTL